MSHTFKVGEIAIFGRRKNDGLPTSPDSPVIPSGTEVTVTGSLQLRYVRTDGGPVEIRCYKCERDGREFAATPEMLRKRRPPQDWVKLCSLTDIPREVAHG